MHQMLWGWKAELQAVPASSLLVCPSLTFSFPAAHISAHISVQGCTQTEFFMLSLQAETSSLESIDTWSGVAVKMMRMMML